MVQNNETSASVSVPIDVAGMVRDSAGSSVIDIQTSNQPEIGNSLKSAPHVITSSSTTGSASASIAVGQSSTITTTPLRFKKRKPSSVSASSPLKQTLQAYFSARTNDLQNGDTETADKAFGKMVGLELSQISNDDIKVDVKKSISDLLFTARQQEKSKSSSQKFAPLFQYRHQPNLQLNQHLSGQCESVSQPQIMSVYLSPDGTLQLAE
jgi:hypothetical protein